MYQSCHKNHPVFPVTESAKGITYCPLASYTLVNQERSEKDEKK